jgi:diguanylate cyclase (GGDEF)-like protein
MAPSRSSRRGNRSPHPIRRRLALGFAVVALLPVSLLGAGLYAEAWEDARREVREKHRLLAENLATPVKLYLDNHRQKLDMLAASLSQGMPADAVLAQGLEQGGGFDALALAGPDGTLRSLATRPDRMLANPPQSLIGDPALRRGAASDGVAVSGVRRGPLTDRPALVMTLPVHLAGGQRGGVLVGELDRGLIERLRRTIRFGEQGHSAIVDHRGRVVAHPNPEWRQSMKDIAHWPVVQSMLAGRTGVAEFYSPYIEAPMIAGYAAVPDYGWGIMVPQPRSEVAQQVWALLLPQLPLVLAGLGLGVVLALAMARWITGPIHHLAAVSQQLNHQDAPERLAKLPARAPRELHQLAHALQDLVTGLQRSYRRIHQLNSTLQSRVEERTEELRTANAELARLAGSDHLTQVANRRQFEAALGEILNNRRRDVTDLTLLLIDLDNFKAINDRFGHPAGDTALVQVAGRLKGHMRGGDLLARLGGDEFVAALTCDYATARQRADEIRAAIADLPVRTGEAAFQLTASIGLYHLPLAEAPRDPAELMDRVDGALYRAKDGGRNQVREAAAS